MAFFIKMIAESKKGVMARITALLARKGYDLKSICAGKHLIDGEATVIMKMEGSEDEAMNARNILGKVVEVISVDVYKDHELAERELCLLKVKKDWSLEVLNGASAKVVKETAEYKVIEIVGTPEVIDSAVEKAKSEEGLIDISRSGINAM